MGTGNGIIPVLMQSKNPGSTYSALEIQEGSAQLARRNVELNHLEDRISVVKGDIKEASTIFGEASFNVVTSNPPYMNENHGIVTVSYTHLMRMVLLKMRLTGQQNCMEQIKH